MTGRPDIQSYFDGWDADWILPDSEQNLRDLRQLMIRQLDRAKMCPPEGVDAAADILVQKSKVRGGRCSLLHSGSACADSLNILLEHLLIVPHMKLPCR